MNFYKKIWRAKLPAFLMEAGRHEDEPRRTGAHLDHTVVELR